MSSAPEKPNAAAVQLSPEDIRQFLYREARFLDDKEWENWLALYAPDVEFWMPAWDDDDQLVTDPQTEISLIWYGNKGGLEDRVFRIGTERSSATSLPAAKGGVNAITACLAFEYAEHGIRVCGVAPGGIEAPPRRIPRNSGQVTEHDKARLREVMEQTVASTLMKRLGTPEEEAAAILFLASDDASYITGVTLPVAGGDLG
jgi:hypothetical protein